MISVCRATCIGIKSQTKIVTRHVRVKYQLAVLLLILFLINAFQQKSIAADLEASFRLKVKFEAEGVINTSQIVVALVPENSLSSLPLRKGITQSNAQFQPFVSIAQSHSTVEFSNNDEFEHHVYSFSKPLSFELPLYRGNKAQELKLKKAGIVPIGCNIHDWMLGYIAIVDTPYFTFIDNDVAIFEDMPEGKYQVMIWHPSMEDFWTSLIVISPSKREQTVQLPFTLEPVAPFPTPTLEEIELEDY